MAEADFHASSSRGKALSLSDFQGKVPVVLVFVGPLDPGSREVADLDRHHVEFGRERVQLLVVARADGADVRAVPFSGLDLPVLADPHDDLRTSFGAVGAVGAEPAGSGGRKEAADEPHFAVILDKQGHQVERLRFAGAEALVARVRELGEQLHA